MIKYYKALRIKKESASAYCVCHCGGLISINAVKKTVILQNTHLICVTKTAEAS